MWGSECDICVCFDRMINNVIACEFWCVSVSSLNIFNVTNDL